MVIFIQRHGEIVFTPLELPFHAFVRYCDRITAKFWLVWRQGLKNDPWVNFSSSWNDSG